MLAELERLSEAAGVAVSEGQARAMRKFWGLVLDTNKHTNLTRITDDRDAVLKHFVDSLTVLKTDVLVAGARLVDVGTGAGFPGIPLKIVRPDVRLTLVDATLKRVRFLRRVVEAMGWTDVETVHGRAEKVGNDRAYKGQFDAAVARAVAPMDRLVTLCMPFLKEGGAFVAMKGPDGEAELDGADGSVKALGGRVREVHRLSLPEGAGRRTLIVVEKGSPGGRGRRVPSN